MLSLYTLIEPQVVNEGLLRPDLPFPLVIRPNQMDR